MANSINQIASFDSPGRSQKSAVSALIAGAGTMGAGIAQVAAQAGDNVVLFDRNTEACDQAVKRISRSLRYLSDKGAISQEGVLEILARVKVSDSLDGFPVIDVVIKSIKEDLKTKQDFFVSIETLVSSGTTLLSNTSMISISSLATVLQSPERFAGAHFFNPVQQMRLVEIIAGKSTSPATVQCAVGLVKKWGKDPVLAPDSSGFIVNRVLDALKREALHLLEEGVPATDIDTALRLGLNFPMGPFELMDLIGLDTTYDCLCNQARQMNRPYRFGT